MSRYEELVRRRAEIATKIRALDAAKPQVEQAVHQARSAFAAAAGRLNTLVDRRKRAYDDWHRVNEEIESRERSGPLH